MYMPACVRVMLGGGACPSLSLVSLISPLQNSESCGQASGQERRKRSPWLLGQAAALPARPRSGLSRTLTAHTGPAYFLVSEAHVRAPPGYSYGLARLLRPRELLRSATASSVCNTCCCAPYLGQILRELPEPFGHPWRPLPLGFFGCSLPVLFWRHASAPLPPPPPLPLLTTSLCAMLCGSTAGARGSMAQAVRAPACNCWAGRTERNEGGGEGQARWKPASGVPRGPTSAQGARATLPDPIPIPCHALQRCSRVAAS
jgi:hypothetical protein